MSNLLKLHKFRLELYKSTISFFKEKKLDVVAFNKQVLLGADEELASKFPTSINVISIDKNGDMVASIVETNEIIHVRLAECNVIQIAYLLDELQKERFEVLQEAE